MTTKPNASFKELIVPVSDMQDLFDVSKETKSGEKEAEKAAKWCG